SSRLVGASAIELRLVRKGIDPETLICLSGQATPRSVDDPGSPKQPIALHPTLFRSSGPTGEPLAYGHAILLGVGQSLDSRDDPRWVSPPVIQTDGDDCGPDIDGQTHQPRVDRDRNGSGLEYRYETTSVEP